MRVCGRVCICWCGGSSSCGLQVEESVAFVFLGGRNRDLCQFWSRLQGGNIRFGRSFGGIVRGEFIENSFVNPTELVGAGPSAGSSANREDYCNRKERRGNKTMLHVACL